MNCIKAFNTFFLIKVFRKLFSSVLNRVVSMGFLVPLLKRDCGIRFECMINKSFYKVLFLLKERRLKRLQ